MHLVLDEIQLSVDKKSNLFEISRLELKENSKTLIVGPSGSGKSTFLHLLSGLLQPKSGRVQWGSTCLQDLSEADITRFRRYNIGFIFQRLNLISHLTPIENVWLFDERQTESDAQALLNKYGISQNLRRWSSTLSLGEQQRVAAARAQLKRPSILLADEPTSSLDDTNAKMLMKAILHPGFPQTLIVVSHDLRLTQLFERVIDFRDWQPTSAKKTIGAIP